KRFYRNGIGDNMRFLSAFLAFFVSAYVIRGEPINVSYALSQDSVILDVRTPDEYLSGHIKGAINIDFYASDFQNQLGKLDKEKDYKVYCRSGNRSSKAVNMMKLALKMSKTLEVFLKLQKI
ncbi:MAG: rhodanese-like domain-containing protein, partial [Bdellovibrionaceae bacterium]|nr:rhodanese-like domain-containing protein [Pseudobdellovibrionaceae bacterium]